MILCENCVFEHFVYNLGNFLRQNVIRNNRLVILLIITKKTVYNATD